MLRSSLGRLSDDLHSWVESAFDVIPFTSVLAGYKGGGL